MATPNRSARALRPHRSAPCDEEAQGRAYGKASTLYADKRLYSPCIKKSCPHKESSKMKHLKATPLECHECPQVREGCVWDAA